MWLVPFSRSFILEAIVPTIAIEKETACNVAPSSTLIGIKKQRPAQPPDSYG